LDGLKPVPALEFETSQMIAHGARCSVGDQMHPRGTLDKSAYDLIGHCYSRVAALEPWLENAQAVTEIGLFSVPSGDYNLTVGSTDEGATRMLTQLKQQFDLVGPEIDLTKYRVVILPDSVEVDAKVSKTLEDYLTRGGSILATGRSGLSRDGSQVEFAPLQVAAHGISPFTTTYIRFGDRINRDVPASDHVMYETGWRVSPKAGTEVLAQIVEPYFQRAWNHFSSHNQTPPDKLSQWPAATQNGRVVYVSTPVFQAYSRHGNYPYRLLVRNLLDRLLPDQVLKVDGPTGLETTVSQQAFAGGTRTIVHLLYYAPERRAANYDIIDDLVPLHDLSVSLKLPAAPKSVYLAPGREPLRFEYAAGRATLRVPKVNGHAVIVFE